MATRNIVLIRHSESQVTPGLPARQWPLTEEGKRRCQVLARRLAHLDLAAIITSDEEKARQTGSIVARSLRLPLSVEQGLGEHERPFLPEEEFRQAIEAFFAQPRARVFGNESAEEALSRFSRAVSAALDRHQTGDVAIVTHGTVLSLYVASHSDWEALPFWRQLGQPAYVRFRFPSVTLAETALAIV